MLPSTPSAITAYPLAPGMSDAHDSPATPPEIDEALTRLAAYRNVRGVMILVRDPLAIVKATGAVFEGEGGKSYARAVEDIVRATTKAITECEEGDILRLMRIRTKRHELIITPDGRFLSVVLQDPDP